MTDPEPAVGTVKVTEQLARRRLHEKPLCDESTDVCVVEVVSVNVTVPAGALEGVVVSATVAVTEAVQLLAPKAILQLTFPTLVEVLSFARSEERRVGNERILVL